MTGRKPKKFTAFLWHRRIGLVAIVLVIILAITGIMLNHTEELKLDESEILVLNNLTGRPQSVEIELRNLQRNNLEDLLSGRTIDMVSEKSLQIELHPYQYLWIRF